MLVVFLYSMSVRVDVVCVSAYGWPSPSETEARPAGGDGAPGHCTAWAPHCGRGKAHSEGKAISSTRVTVEGHGGGSRPGQGDG
jgi:hypothetical protein